MRILFLCAALAGCGPATMTAPDAAPDAPDGASSCDLNGVGVSVSGFTAGRALSCTRVGSSWSCGTPSFAGAPPQFCNPDQGCAVLSLSFRSDPLTVAPGTVLALGSDVTLESVGIGVSRPSVLVPGPYVGTGTLRRTDDAPVVFVVRAAVRSSSGECVSIDVDATLNP